MSIRNPALANALLLFIPKKYMKATLFITILALLHTGIFSAPSIKKKEVFVSSKQKQDTSKDRVVFNFHFEPRSMPALFYFDINNQQHYIIRPSDFPNKEKSGQVLTKVVQTSEPIFVEYLVLPKHTIVYVKPGDVLDVFFNATGTPKFTRGTQSFNLDLFSELSKNNESLFEFEWNKAIRNLPNASAKRVVLSAQHIKTDKLLDSLRDIKQISPESYYTYKKLCELFFLTSDIQLVGESSQVFSAAEQTRINENLKLSGWDKALSYREFVYSYYTFICKTNSFNTAEKKFKFISEMPEINARNYMLFLALKEIRKEAPSGFDQYKERFYRLCSDTNYVRYVQINTQKNIPNGSSGTLISHSAGKSPIDFKVWLSQQKGNIVYIDLWASWCSPCRSEMPNSRELKKYFQGKKVVFGYFSVDKVVSDWQSANKEELLSNYPNSFLLRNEQKDPVLNKIDLSTIPRYVIFNKAGVLVNSNADRPGSAEIKTILSKMLLE